MPNRIGDRITSPFLQGNELRNYRNRVGADVHIKFDFGVVAPEQLFFIVGFWKQKGKDSIVCCIEGAPTTTTSKDKNDCPMIFYTMESQITSNTRLSDEEMLTHPNRYVRLLLKSPDEMLSIVKHWITISQTMKAGGTIV